MTEHTGEVKTFGNPPIPVEDVVDEEGNTYCQIHTDIQTGLRCNNCGRLMCAKCAVKTPVGYRCEQCIRQQENRFFNADYTYYIKIVAICAALSVAGAFVANIVGWFLFVFFVSIAAGGIISETTMRFIKGQRGRYAGEAAAAGIVIGVLILMLILYARIQPPPEVIAQLRQQYGDQADAILRQVRPSFFAYVFSSWDVLLYTVITAVTVYGRFNIYGRKR